MDKKNVIILQALQQNARISMAELATKACLSAPATAERVRKLEEQGIIKGYSADIDYAQADHNLTALVRIKPFSGNEPGVIRFLKASPHVVNVLNVTGEYAFVASVSVRAMSVLDTLLEALSQLGVTDTSVVLSEVKAGQPQIPAP